LGNLTKVLKLDLSGAKKTKKLIQSIETRISSNKINSIEKEQIQVILKDTKEFIQHGEWFVGFEIMVTNLDEIYFKIEKEELILMKEIFQKAKVDWKKEWAWIEELEKENEL